MEESTTGQFTNPTFETLPQNPSFQTEPRWSMAFAGIVGYLIVEYMRLPLSYEVFRLIYIGKVVIVVAALGWLLSNRSTGGNPSLLRSMDIALVFMLLGASFSMLFARYTALAWDGFVDLVKWALIYFLISRILVSSWRMKIFIFLLLLLNLKLARGGVRYFYATKSSYNEAVAVRQGAKAGSTGFFSNSADLGVAMCVVWPIATMLLFAKLKGRWRLALLISSLGFLFTILICGSRGAVVGAVCTVLAGVLASRQRIAALVMAVLMIPGIYFIIPQASKKRFASAYELEGDMTAQARLRFWRAGIAMFFDKPLVGVGLKNFPLTRLAGYVRPGDSETAYVPHSIYIEVLSELGLAGIVPTAVIIVCLFKLNAKTRKILLALDPKRRSSYEYCLASGLDLALVGYLASGAFVAVFRYPHLWVLMGMSAGLHAACLRLSSHAVSSEPTLVEHTKQPQMVKS